jgi:hypothetical protein
MSSAFGSRPESSAAPSLCSVTSVPPKMTVLSASITT